MTMLLFVWLAPSARAQVPPAATKEGDVPKVTTANKEKKKLTPKGMIELPSLFFTPEERDAIERAKIQYTEGAVAETEVDLLDQLQGIKQTSKKAVDEPQETVYPQFYLETLMYHTPGDWTIWIKDLKGSRKFLPTEVATSDKLLKVVVIEKEGATFEWSPKNWIAVSKAYKQGTPQVSIDESRKTVIFTLRVNQTMTSNDMQVKEGVVAPVTVAPEAPAQNEKGLQGVVAGVKNAVDSAISSEPASTNADESNDKPNSAQTKP